MGILDDLFGGISDIAGSIGDVVGDMGSGIGDILGKGVDFLGKNANTIGGVGSILGGLYSASQATDVMNQAAAAADPFASQRGQYQQMLQALMTSPGSFALSPAAQATLDIGRQNLERSAAAKGFLGSGNVLGELMNYGQQVASQDYWKQIQNLQALSGATTGSPAAAGASLASIFDAQQRAMSQIGAGAAAMGKKPGAGGGLGGLGGLSDLIGPALNMIGGDASSIGGLGGLTGGATAAGLGTSLLGVLGGAYGIMQMFGGGSPLEMGDYGIPEFSDFGFA